MIHDFYLFSDSWLSLKNFWTGYCKLNKNVCKAHVNICYVKELIQDRTNKMIHLLEIINIL